MKNTTKIILALVLLSCTLFNNLGAQRTDSLVTLDNKKNLRNYRVHVPANHVRAPAKPYPAVILFHGGGNGGAKEFQTRSGFDFVGDTAKFITIYLQSRYAGEWADSRGTKADTAGIDDVSLALKILDTLKMPYNIDTTKIYAAGLSTGGFMSQRLALDPRSKIAAVASVGVSLTTSIMPYFPPSRKIPVLYMVGTADPRNPYYGGVNTTGIGDFINTDNAVAYWASFDSCSSSPTVYIFPDKDPLSLTPSTVTKITYTHCQDSSEVVFYRIQNGGHTWPGGVGQPASLGNVNLDINGSHEIWSFFRRHRLQTSAGNVTDGTGPLFSYSGSSRAQNGLQLLHYNTIGHSNTGNGFQALWHNTEGFDNTATGRAALYKNTEGDRNSATGKFALFANTVGSNNTANGESALFSNTTGENNTAVGARALHSNHRGIGPDLTVVHFTNINTTDTTDTTDPYGISDRTDSLDPVYPLDTLYPPIITVGHYDLRSHRITGSRNTAIGATALHLNVSGSDNTGTGYEALLNNTEGDYNTAIGVNALSKLVNGSGNLAIGHGSGTSTGYLNNTVSIGNIGYLNYDHNQVFIGNRSTVWNGGNRPWLTYSDARIKNKIHDDVVGLDFITRLRPVTYYRSIKAMTEITGDEETPDYPEKYDIEKIKFSGFLAQDVEKAAKEAQYDFSGIIIPKKNNELYSLSYEEFVVPLVKAVQELSAKNTEMNLLIAALKSENNSLSQRLEKLETFLEANVK